MLAHMIARDAKEYPETIPSEIQGVAHYTFCACFRVTPFLTTVLGLLRPRLPLSVAHWADH